MQTFAHNLSKPFHEWSLWLAWMWRLGLFAKCAGLVALPFLCSFPSFSHEHNMVEHCRLCFAHTLSDARISPRMCGARTFHEWYNQPLQHDTAVYMSNATMACSGCELERRIKGRRRHRWPMSYSCTLTLWHYSTTLPPSYMSCVTWLFS